MKSIRNALVFSILSLIGLAGIAPQAKADVVIDFNTYAAVAFSPSTGKYGYAWNHGSRSGAERVALSRCTETDARIVGWVKGGWLVVAIGDDNTYGVGYEYGQGANSRVAKLRALKELGARTKGSETPKVFICLCSGDFAPEIVR